MRSVLAAVILGFVAVFSASAEDAPEPTRSLSLDDCVQMALNHNLDVQIQRINPVIDRFTLESSRGSYDPTWSSTIDESFRKSDVQINPQLGILTGGDETTTEFGRTGINGVLPYSGLTYDLSTSVNRNTGNRFIGELYSISTGATLTQPLLKNLWIDGPRRSILVGRRNVNISELRLKSAVIDVITLVERAYYDLIFAAKNVEVQQQSLALAEQLLADNQKRVEVGTMAPLEEKQAQAQVAARKADLISSLQTLGTQQNTLKNLLTDDFLAWSEVLIQPTETLIAVEGNFDKQNSWRKGIAMRPDLLLLKEDLEKQNIEVRYSHNQLFPALDLVGSYRQIGLDSNFRDTAGESLSGRNPAYSIGARLTVPLGNRSARNRFRATKAVKQQAILRLKQSEQNIIVEIDNAIKTAQSNYRRVEATREARKYAEAALDAEEKKLANGASTSFVVLQLQKDLTDARSSELRSLADYNKSLADLAKSEGTTLEKKKLSLDLE